MPCAACGGRGFNNCTACGGAGHTMISKSRIGLGGRIEYYQDRLPCTGCFSSGKITCAVCGGTGSVLQSPVPAPRQSRRKQPQPEPQQFAPQEFEFVAYQFYRHPAHDEITALWQHNPGNVLDVCPTLSTTMRVELAAWTKHTWVQLRDDSGRLVPLAIRVDGSGALFGKWL